MRNITRRGAVNALVGAAATPALAAPALAARSGDAKLRELWAQYLEDLAAEQAACLQFHTAQAAYDAEVPPRPDDVSYGDHDAAQRPLWIKHGLDRLYSDWNDAGERTDEIVEAIQEEEAEGLFGIGVKLAALPLDSSGSRDPAPEHEDAIVSALTEIDRLIGSTFVSAFSVHVDAPITEEEIVATIAAAKDDEAVS
jgi:hypothetical protein